MSPVLRAKSLARFLRREFGGKVAVALYSNMVTAHVPGSNADIRKNVRITPSDLQPKDILDAVQKKWYDRHGKTLELHADVGPHQFSLGSLIKFTLLARLPQPKNKG